MTIWLIFKVSSMRITPMRSVPPSIVATGLSGSFANDARDLSGHLKMKLPGHVTDQHDRAPSARTSSRLAR